MSVFLVTGVVADRRLSTKQQCLWVPYESTNDDVLVTGVTVDYQLNSNVCESTNDDESTPSSCYSHVNLVLIGDKSEVLCSPAVTWMSVNLSLWQWTDRGQQHIVPLRPFTDTQTHSTTLPLRPFTNTQTHRHTTTTQTLHQHTDTQTHHYLSDPSPTHRHTDTPLPPLIQTLNLPSTAN